MKTYAIWKNKEVVGYIELTELQVKTLNSISNSSLYFGFDKVINPEKYK
ncbi:hypothetical protein ACYJ2U_001804 [Clostridium botulinum]